MINVIVSISLCVMIFITFFVIVSHHIIFQIIQIIIHVSFFLLGKICLHSVLN